MSWERAVMGMNLDDILDQYPTFEIAECFGIDYSILEKWYKEMDRETYLQQAYLLAEVLGRDKGDIAAAVASYDPETFGFDSNDFVDED